MIKPSIAATTLCVASFVATCKTDHLFSHAFVNNAKVSRSTNTHGSLTNLHVAPRRLNENVEGPLYVNEKCINCAACSMFAPSVFERRHPKDGAHIVYHQPSTEQEVDDARAALAACPVAAIRVDTKTEESQEHAQNNQQHSPLVLSSSEIAKKLAINPKFNGLDLPFPRPISQSLKGEDTVYFVGHHNDASFGATPYLVSTKSSSSSKLSWIMVDTPRYSKSAVAAVEQITGPQGPEYLFLTHVDDTADHGKWKEHYPNLKRIFHAGDLGRHNWIGDKTLEEVEILLRDKSSDDESVPLKCFRLNGTPIDSADNSDDSDVVVIHTPGHSPGSISLWKRPTENSPGVLFSGDSYSYTTRNGGHMTGFPRYGNDRRQQARTLPRLLTSGQGFDWQILAPGHGHVRDYAISDSHESTSGESKDKIPQRQKEEMKDAIKELQSW